jgi:hypothetical protein
VDTKLMDYSANTIYNAFINVGKYGATKKTIYKAYAYDNSNNLVGNQVNWIDPSNACPFTDAFVGRPLGWNKYHLSLHRRYE